MFVDSQVARVILHLQFTRPPLQPQRATASGIPPPTFPPHSPSTPPDPAPTIATNPLQLCLLADHIKLSLLERQRARMVERHVIRWRRVACTMTMTTCSTMFGNGEMRQQCTLQALQRKASKANQTGDWWRRSLLRRFRFALCCSQRHPSWTRAQPSLSPLASVLRLFYSFGAGAS